MPRTPNDRALNAAWAAPGVGVVAITPADSDLTDDLRGLYVGGAGDISIICPDGSTAILKAVPVGSWVPLFIRQVKSTGTTATLLVGFY